MNRNLSAMAPPKSDVPSVMNMPLRDYFAAKAMQVDYQQIKDCSDPYWRECLAIDAYKMADAMLKARSK